MDKIWLISVGEYSDYNVIGAYTDKALAEDFVKILNANPDNWSDHRLEERTLNEDPRVQKEYLQGKRLWFLRMDRNGNVLSTSNGELFINQIDFRLNYKPMKYSFTMSGNLNIEVWARDKDHAIKVANEKRVQIIAQNKWGVNEE